jgi:hypothetical protein
MHPDPISGRNLLTMNDIARFARPAFDPLAFLLELVCESTQVPVKIRPHDLRPTLAKLIQSAMTLTPDGFVAAMITHPPTPAGRPRFAYHIPECSLPNPHTVPGTLPFEISSPPSHLWRHGWTIPLLHLRRRPPILTPCVT